jgi:hypothetical protein
MCPKLIGTVGLVFDMVGAILVAIEVVRVYRGQITSITMGTAGKPTPEFKKYEGKKRKWMGVGLIFLLLGFLLQIIALWMK